MSQFKYNPTHVMLKSNYSGTHAELVKNVLLAINTHKESHITGTNANQEDMIRHIIDLYDLDIVAKVIFDLSNGEFDADQGRFPDNASYEEALFKVVNNLSDDDLHKKFSKDDLEKESTHLYDDAYHRLVVRHAGN